MSRAYRMELEFHEPLTQLEEAEAAEAFEEVWVKDGEYGGGGKCLTLYGSDSLGGGRSDACFARDLTDAVWKRLRRHVKFDVRCIYLEDPPTEVYPAEEINFKEWARTSACDECGKMFVAQKEGEEVCKCQDE